MKFVRAAVLAGIAGIILIATQAYLDARHDRTPQVYVPLAAAPMNERQAQQTVPLNGTIHTADAFTVLPRGTNSVQMCAEGDERKGYAANGDLICGPIADKSPQTMSQFAQLPDLSGSSDRMVVGNGAGSATTMTTLCMPGYYRRFAKGADGSTQTDCVPAYPTPRELDDARDMCAANPNYATTRSPEFETACEAVDQEWIATRKQAHDDEAARATAEREKFVERVAQGIKEGKPK